MIPFPTEYFFSFLLAFCSLFYELVYAQVLSVCLGGTKIQYITTIALFTCALGLGSISFRRVVGTGNVRSSLFKVEAALMILGGTGPFIITWLLQPGSNGTLQTFTVILSYGFIFLIGFLSGFELPSLFLMKPSSEGKILAWDYIGMLAASVCFPLLFLPSLGTAASTLFVASLNGFALVWLKSPSRLKSFLLCGVLGAFITSVIFYREPLNEILSQLYLGGGA